MVLASQRTVGVATQQVQAGIVGAGSAQKEGAEGAEIEDVTLIVTGSVSADK